MKRIIVLLTVVALMMVMLAMSIAPAFARGGPCPRGEHKAPVRGTSTYVCVPIGRG